MAKVNLQTITDPLEDERPCGPDLDMEFDMDFMNLVAELDGKIPTAFFSFDPGSVDFDDFYNRIGDALQRTRDLRVLVPLAKLRVLQSDLSGFAEALDAIHRLLRERWTDLHPQPAEFLELGMGQLATLDDMPNVILPLQHAPLVRSRRSGAITLRKWLVANGDVNARDGEETIDAGTLISALAESDASDVARSRGALVLARDAVAGIRKVCIEEAGYDKAPTLERLPAALEAAIALIETATGESPAGEGAAQAADGSGAPAAAATAIIELPAGAVKTREQAVEAMHVSARYFALREPSSPVPMLLREAQAASAKSFYELVNDLVPEIASSAFVSLGNEPWFEVYLSTLDGRNPAPEYHEEVAAEEMAEDAGLGDDEKAADDAPNADDADNADEDDAGEDDAGEDGAGEPDGEANSTTSSEDDGEADAVAEAGEADAPDVEAAEEPAQAATDEVPEIAGAPGAQGGFTANSRAEAVALLRQVLEYYRVAEPSSPVPLLVERAIDMSSKTFIELLGNVLPDGSLKVRPQDSG